jgi:GNAT superfamily N-acetyltransferase
MNAIATETAQVPEIRAYTEGDARDVGILIADTYGTVNLAAMSSGDAASMLGPFAFARSPAPVHQAAIAEAICAPSVWVADLCGEIVGVLRGGRTDHRGRTVLSSLFVARRHHRQGIGRALVERFEQEYAARGVCVFTTAATEYAVAFYLSLGYKKSTGVRTMSSFGQPGLRYQPMKKVLDLS